MTVPVNFVCVDRHWFLRWTTYGTWLPGDRRGFVGKILDEAGRYRKQSEVGTPPAPPDDRVRKSAEWHLKCPSIILNQLQADALFAQLHETADTRGWLLIAVGIMRTHLHICVGVPGDPDPDKILGDFKAYSSRVLNRGWGKPPSDSWWTSGGSTRKLPDEVSIEAAVNYIWNQANAFLIWTRESGFKNPKTNDPQQ